MRVDPDEADACPTLRDGPGVAGAQELVELLRAEPLTGLLQLARHGLAVEGALRGAKDADGGGPAGPRRQVCQGEGLAGIRVVRVVDQ